MRAHWRRQLFAVDQLDQHRGGLGDAAAVVAGAEPRHQVLLDDAVGGGVGNRAFQPIAGLDAHPPIVLGHHQQYAVVHALAADLPLIEHALGVLLDRFRRSGRDHQHLQLAALALLQLHCLLFQREALGRLQGAGGIDHRRVQRRNRRLAAGLCPGQQRQQRQQQHSDPGTPTAARRALAGDRISHCRLLPTQSRGGIERKKPQRRPASERIGHPGPPTRL